MGGGCSLPWVPTARQGHAHPLLTTACEAGPSAGMELRIRAARGCQGGSSGRGSKGISQALWPWLLGLWDLCVLCTPPPPPVLA